MNNYLRRDFFLVEGSCNHFDGVIFDTLLAGQSEAGIPGSMVEIGIHHGRTFFILAGARRADEKALAVDVFEDDEFYQDPKGFGRGAWFQRNCSRLDIALDENEVFVGRSTLLDRDEIRRRIGEVRFFSVDGGHGYDDVLYDLTLAGRTIAPRGVIVADDFMNPGWPEVSAALADWLRDTGDEFRPFLCTPWKIYLCRKSEFNFYVGLTAGLSSEGRSLAQPTHYFGNRFQFVRPRMTARLRVRAKEVAIVRLASVAA